MIKLKSLNLLLKKTGSFHSKNQVFHIVNLEVFSFPFEAFNFILKVFQTPSTYRQNSLVRVIYLYQEGNKTPSRGKFIYITREFRVFILYYI